MNRINLITLGVRDMATSLIFYRDGLCFETSVSEENPGVVFFNCRGTKLSLYPLEALAIDTGESEQVNANGFKGFTLAYNAKSPEEVETILKMAVAAGGKLVKPAQNTFWGGYSGYFTDPDGYYWEVAFADFWKFDENDMLIID